MAQTLPLFFDLMQLRSLFSSYFDSGMMGASSRPTKHTDINKNANLKEPGSPPPTIISKVRMGTVYIGGSAQYTPKYEIA
eukprot:scaffold38136_cov69-Cyclotella_meneghiniana.AAC.7